jgi:hypothetical protein
VESNSGCGQAHALIGLSITASGTRACVLSCGLHYVDQGKTDGQEPEQGAK